jgi:hypothetical protein
MLNGSLHTCHKLYYPIDEGSKVLNPSILTCVTLPREWCLQKFQVYKNLTNSQIGKLINKSMRNWGFACKICADWHGVQCEYTKSGKSVTYPQASDTSHIKLLYLLASMYFTYVGPREIDGVFIASSSFRRRANPLLSISLFLFACRETPEFKHPQNQSCACNNIIRDGISHMLTNPNFHQMIVTGTSLWYLVANQYWSWCPLNTSCDS